MGLEAIAFCSLLVIITLIGGLISLYEVITRWTNSTRRNIQRPTNTSNLEQVCSFYIITSLLFVSMFTVTIFSLNSHVTGLDCQLFVKHFGVANTQYGVMFHKFKNKLFKII